MAKQKDPFKDIARKTSVELTKMLSEAKDRLWALHAELAQGKVKSVKEIHSLKKTIARVLTVMNKEKVNA